MNRPGVFHAPLELNHPRSEPGFTLTASRRSFSSPPPGGVPWRGLVLVPRSALRGAAAGGAVLPGGASRPAGWDEAASGRCAEPGPPPSGCCRRCTCRGGRNNTVPTTSSGLRRCGAASPQSGAARASVLGVTDTKSCGAITCFWCLCELSGYGQGFGFFMPFLTSENVMHEQ